MEWNGKYKIGNNDFVTLLRIKLQPKKHNSNDIFHIYFLDLNLSTKQFSKNQQQQQWIKVSLKTLNIM